MKSGIRFISIGLIAFALPAAVGGVCSALSDRYLDPFSQNDIMFYDPEACNADSGICGETAQEIYWTALRSKFGTVQTAAIVGNISKEGGFNPAKVGCYDKNNQYWFDPSTGQWAAVDGWEEYRTSNTPSNGVGSFQITAKRVEYLRYVGNKAPSLLTYFAEPWNYSFGCPFLEGEPDALLQKIGKADFGKLVQLEVEFVANWMQERDGFDFNHFATMTDVTEASDYFAVEFEACKDCQYGSSELKQRAAAAQKFYDEYASFICTSTRFKSKGFAVTDDKIRGLIRVALEENSCNDSAVLKEISLMANLAEHHGMKLVKYVLEGKNGVTRFSDNAIKRFYQTDWRASDVDRLLGQAKDILRNGNRTIPKEVTKRDTFSDIEWIETNGKKYTGQDEIRNRSLYKYGKTKIHTRSSKNGSYYIFYAWASDPESDDCDPFGFDPSNAPENPTGGKRAGSSSARDHTWAATYDADLPSSIPTADYTPMTPIERFTFIGDAIGIGIRDSLEKKFPDSFFSVVNGRRPAAAGNCPNDEGGGLQVLQALVNGSGQVATTNDGSCDMVKATPNSLSKAIVWELGGDNPDGAEKTIERVLDLIGTRYKLFLVTPYDGASDKDDEIAEMYRRTAKAHDNVYVIDWNRAARSDPNKYLGGSTMYPNDEGNQLLIDLISQTLASTSICGGGLDDFQWYAQCDPAWGDTPLGDSTVCRSGSGPASFAMIASALFGQKITPAETAEVANEGAMLPEACNGTCFEITEHLADHYGLEYKEVEVSDSESWAQSVVNEINALLKKGWMLHVSGRGSAPFTEGGHYIAIVGLTDDNQWQVANSANQDEEGLTTYDPIGVVKAGFLRDRALTAVRSNGAVTCDNECEPNNGPVTSGIQSVAEANRLVMDVYKRQNEQVLINRGWIGRTNCSGGSMANCVAFSQYFLNRYTTRDIPGLPNGKLVVGDLIKRYHLQDGGTIPRAYSVFSSGHSTHYGHTGVILGINAEKGYVITGEAGCGAPLSAAGARERSLKDVMSGSYTYAYTDNILKKGELPP